ncbi:MAG: hypothetical protein N2512_05980 [Armatimonadetes bacterium]|nr:hypothetical protein [Armatimonadota bacterium]
MRVAIRLVPAILAILLVSDTVAAAGVDLSTTRKVFRVCILVPLSGTNENPNFFIALQRCPLKPAGWELENPLAPRFTPQLVPTNKLMPEYWQVSLTAESAPRLKEFDLIYIASKGLLTSPPLRLALVEAVRSGTTLWIDSGGVGPNFFATVVEPQWAPPRYLRSPVLPPFDFVPPVGPANLYRDPYPAAVDDPLGDPNSELFVRPFALSMDPNYPDSSDEVRLLGDAPAPGAACDGYHLLLRNPGDTDQQLHVILATRDLTSGWAAPAVATCQYGDGHIIVSAINIGQDVEEWYVQGAKGPDKYQTPDVKFAYNVLAWGGAWETSRRSASGVAEARSAATPPLDIAWQYPLPPVDDAEAAASKIGPVLAAPAVAHGRIYVVSLISDDVGGTTTPARLFCFDARPERDLDGDGSADDGLPDYSLGLPYDLVWWRDLNDLAGPSGITDATPRWAGPTVADLPIHILRADRSLCTFVVLVAFVSQGGGLGTGCVAAVDGETGALRGAFPVSPFDVLWNDFQNNPNPAQVRDISTPVVRDGWVYFVCSEYDEDLVPAPGDRQSPGGPVEPPSANWLADGTYGRAWCINLQFLAAPSVTPLYYWCYPDPDLDRDGVPHPVDADDTERQNLLPPFAEPLWVAGVFPQDPRAAGRPRQIPPDPGVIPVITTTTRRADDVSLLAYEDQNNVSAAVMHVSTAAGRMFDPAHPNSPLRIGRSFIQYVFDPVGAWHCVNTPDPWDNEYQRRQGGWDLALVPTPAYYDPGSGWNYGLLNKSYYHITVSGGNVTSVQSIVRQDSSSLTLGGGDVLDRAGTTIILKPHRARYLLSATSATPPFDNPLRPPMGVKVLCNYNNGSQNEVHWLPGTIPWLAVNGDQERRVTPAAVRDNRFYAVTSLPDSDAQGRDVDPGARSTARVVSQDLGAAFREWRFDPISEMPAALGFVFPEARTEVAPGANRDTVVAALVFQPNGGGGLAPCVLGLRAEPDLTVNLGSYTGLAPGVGIQPRSTVTVNLLATGLPQVDPTQYTVSYGDATITFDAREAWRIRAGSSQRPEHIYGRPILVTWTDTTGADHSDELYVVPPMTRFDYMPDLIKLRHYPVVANSVQIETVEGLSVTGWAPGEPTVTYLGQDLIPRGWIDLRNATVNGAPLVPGMVLRVHYVGFDNDWGFFGVGSPANAPPSPAPPMPPEEHEVPYGFGPSASSVVLAGTDIHLGTEGWPGAGGAFDVPDGGLSANETLLSLLWDPATGLVRGHLAEAARLGAFQAAPGQIAATTGSPAATCDGLLIGSRVMSNSSQGLQIGFVSALRSRETLIVEGSRILRCRGQDVIGVMTGTESWERGQDPTQDAPIPLPLAHPAKAEVLPSGNLLIVDTGNNRVVEVDPSGQVVWPLDDTGCNYYSSASNTELRLLRPTDAERYQTVGDPDGNGPAGVTQVTNTVIADSGNDRVVLVRTWWEWGGGRVGWGQRHLVVNLTPEYVRETADPTRRVRAHYTQVELIRRPDDGTVVGYLCGAPNLSRLVVIGRDANGTLVMDPPPATPMWNPNNAPGSYDWSLWSWLYSPDGTKFDPLQFAGLRGVCLRRLGAVVYLDVACMQYQGRASAWRAGQRWWTAFDGGGYTGRDPGAGVFEFRVSYGTAPGPIPSAHGPDVPVWILAENPFRVQGGAAASPCYRLTPWSSIAMPGAARPLEKRFVPTSVELLPTGRRLIANSAGLVERLTKRALGQTGVVTTAEVFEVETNDGGEEPPDPANDQHVIDRRRIIPDPYGPDWPDPLIYPVYAHRVMN